MNRHKRLWPWPAAMCTFEDWSLSASRSMCQKASQPVSELSSARSGRIVSKNEQTQGRAPRAVCTRLSKIISIGRPFACNHRQYVGCGEAGKRLCQVFLWQDQHNKAFFPFFKCLTTALQHTSWCFTRSHKFNWLLCGHFDNHKQQAHRQQLALKCFSNAIQIPRREGRRLYLASKQRHL